jgi:PAS domain S-box-containing protein
MNKDIDDAPLPTILGHTPGKNRRDDLMSQIVDHSRDAIWVLDATAADGGLARIIYVNDAFETLYDCSAERAVGREVDDFLRSRFQAREIDAMIEALGRRRAFDLTTRYRRADGLEEIWLAVHGEPRSSDGGVRWYITTRDVTATMTARARAERLARALEYAHEPITVETFYDGDSVIDFVNHAFAKLFGYSSEELIGRSWRSLLSPEVLALAALAGSGPQTRGGLPHRRCNGSERSCRAAVPA